MKTRVLDKQVKDYYTNQFLPEDKLAQLAAQAAVAAGSAKARRRSWYWGAATAVIVVVAVGLGRVVQVGPDHRQWAARAAQEIALNHKKHLREEFVATDFATLRRQMSKLDFSLAEPTSLSALGLRIVGARYCSIQGHLAAQIKLTDVQGRRYTLYQTHIAADMAADVEWRSRIDGIDIRQWREADLFFGLATAME